MSDLVADSIDWGSGAARFGRVGRFEFDRHTKGVRPSRPTGSRGIAAISERQKSGDTDSLPAELRNGRAIEAASTSYPVNRELG